MDKLAKNSGVFEKGTPKPAKSGRKKGVPNKATGDIKAMISNALTIAGGESYLLRQADENPVAFMGLIGKILPKQVDVDANIAGNIAITEIRRVIIKANDNA